MGALYTRVPFDLADAVKRIDDAMRRRGSTVAGPRPSISGPSGVSPTLRPPLLHRGTAGLTAASGTVSEEPRGRLPHPTMQLEAKRNLDGGSEIY
jgi:hypothetical protein